MKKTTFLTASLLGATLLVAACHPAPFRMEEAQYWQRKNATSALYLRGPKAQQTLHVDISRCVSELQELERVGALREALPADTKRGQIPNPHTPQGKLDQWDSPTRDGYLYNEHMPYHDFETCMDSKGWERIEHLPYAQSDVARKDYLRNVAGYNFPNRTNTGKFENNGAASSYRGTSASVND